MLRFLIGLSYFLLHFRDFCCFSEFVVSDSGDFIYIAIWGSGRESPSLLILPIRVVRLRPRRAAAPLGPPTTQCVSRRIFRMWPDSACFRVVAAAAVSTGGFRVP